MDNPKLELKPLPPGLKHAFLSRGDTFPVSISSKLNAGKLRKFQLTKLEELRNYAYENSKIYKAKTKVFHDKNIGRKTFKPNDLVFLYDSRLHKHPGKFRSRWIGPFVVKNVFTNGVVEIKDSKDGQIFKVNGQCLKVLIDRQVLEVEDIPLVDPVYQP